VARDRTSDAQRNPPVTRMASGFIKICQFSEYPTMLMADKNQ
jgi:hypothetical protein